LTPIIGLRLLALGAGLRHNPEIGQPGLCFSAYGHKSCNAAKRRASCLSVLTRSPGRDGTNPGATITLSTPAASRRRSAAQFWELFGTKFDL
jgi:hypothetical protein